MPFNDLMRDFYRTRINSRPVIPCRIPAETFRRVRAFQFIPLLQNILGYSILGFACLHYILTGRFFMIIQDIPAISLIF